MPASRAVHINTISTVVILQRQGVLQAVAVNTRGAQGNRLTLYDSPTASGDIVAIIDCVNAQIGTIRYDIQLLKGLTAVLDTGQAGDVTVCAD